MSHGLQALGAVILLLAFLVQKYKLHDTVAALLQVCMTIATTVLVLRHFLNPALGVLNYVGLEVFGGVGGKLVGFWLASTPEQDRNIWCGRRPAETDTSGKK